MSGRLLAPVAAALLALALYPFDFGPLDEPFNRTLDAGHFLAFGLLALLAEGAARSRGWRHPTVTVAVAMVALAAAIELVQPALGRSATWLDLWNSVAGALVALAWRAASGRWRPAVALAGGVLFFAAALPAWQAWQGVFWQRSHFPVLGTFESGAELALWQARGQGSRVVLSREVALEGEGSLRVESAPGDWGGVKYLAGGMEWRGHRALQLAIYNPGPEPFELELRIDDDRPAPGPRERFSRDIEIRPGWNRFTVELAEIERGPRHGPVDLGAIAKLLLVAERDDPPRLFYLDAVRLTGP